MREYETCSKGEAEEYLRYFEKRFGIPRDKLSDFVFLKRGKNIWVFTGDSRTAVSLERVETIGIKALTIGKKFLKPTTAFLQLVGCYAAKNVVYLKDERELSVFMTGGIIRRKLDVEKGYVIVKYKSDVLGCGLYDGERLISQIPKSRRIDERWLFREG